MNTPGRTVADLGERGIIASIRARMPAPPAWLLLGIGDDAAVAQPERGALEVLTTDALVEDVHFDRRFTRPYDAGWKALAVNLSDIAAMGAAPRLALLSLALPPALPLSDFDELIDGFTALAARERVTLAGGNITRSPGPLMIDVTVTGTVRPRRVLARAGARPGDDIYVTGTIGAGRAGLEMLRAELPTPNPQVRKGLSDRDPRDPRPADPDPRPTHSDPRPENPCVARYRRPDPRCRVGALLGRNRAAGACMDLSDGLADAVRQVAEASGVGIALDAAALPIDPCTAEWFASRGLDPVTASIAGGDDYELLFAVPRRGRRRLETVRRQARGVPLTRIGLATSEPGVRLSREGRVEPLPEGFVHF